MLKNNKEVINRLSKRIFKSNKKRNTVAVIAIILTTFMLSTVFSIGISFWGNMNIMSMRLEGTKANIFFAHPTDEQTEQIKALSGVKSVGLTYSVGVTEIDLGKDGDAETEISALDESEWNNHILPTLGEVQGKYPSEENEITASVSVLEKLGITNPKLGQKIKLEFYSNGEFVSKDFTLCGFFQSFTKFNADGNLYLSEKYCKANNITAAQNGTLNILASSFKADEVTQSLERIADTSLKQSVATSFAAFDSSTKFTLIGTVSAVALFIVFSGYLLIYNIMYISVTKDIHFYGLLKTLGATSKQLKKIVYRQAGLLSVFAVPLGVVLSLLTSFLIVPSAMSLFESDSSAMPSEISFNPLIFVGAVIFSVLTVLTSCRKSAKIAGKVSPIEAVKYTGINNSIKKKQKKSTSGGKLYKMAFRNVFRDKKRAVLVFASLFLGVITFLSVTGFFSSVDVKNYIDEYYPWDFEYQAGNSVSGELSASAFDSKFVNAAENLDGITEKEIIKSTDCELDFDEKNLEPMLKYEYLHYAIGDGEFEDMVGNLKAMASQIGYGTVFYSISERYIKEFNEKYGENVDVDAFKNGEIAVLGYGDYNEMVGRKIGFESKANGFKGEIEVGGVFRSFNDCSVGVYSHTAGTFNAIFVSEKFMEKLCDNPEVSQILLNVKPSAEEEIRSALEELNEKFGIQSAVYSSKFDKTKEFRETMMTMRILTSGISLVFILIGIINFFNVMSTGIYSRKREFAVLESIGMTKKQIFKMLVFEGGYYASLTSLLILTLGSAVMSAVGKVTPYFVDYAKFEYPILTVAILIVSIFLICLAVPPIVYRLSSTESVTERLHSTDN